jgi:uncharacterized protein YfbU (UPF0304 family)
LVPKTERFELRLDPGILERVDLWRSDQDDVPSRAEAVRRLVEIGLLGRSKEGFQLSNPEKLMTWLLTEILKNQKGYESQDTVKLIQEAIYGGHFWALRWDMTGVLHDHVDDPRKVTTVVNILDMWSFIESAFRAFSKADKSRLAAEAGYRGEDPKFMGFDGNNETEYLSIARFLVEEMRRFESFKGRDFNSHMPTVGRYMGMYRLFEPMRAKLIGRELGVDDLITLLKHD